MWPTPQQWLGAILFIETSEQAPPPEQLALALRRYAKAGELQALSGILMGRPGGQISVDAHAGYDAALLQVVRDEAGLTEMPLVTGMDFGHTDPMMTLPYGVRVEIDQRNKQVCVVEAAVT